MYAYILKTTLRCFRLFIAALVVMPALAQATEFSVFEVRKRLPLANGEVPVKDFYVSQGSEAGLKVNMVIDVKRKIPIHDGFKNASRGDLEITIGKLRIIHVEKQIAVGRLFSESTTSQRPITGFETIMIGDFLDIASAAMIVPKKNRESASLPAATSEARAVEPNVKKVQVKSKEKAAEKTADQPSPTHAFVGPVLDVNKSAPLPIQVH